MRIVLGIPPIKTVLPVGTKGWFLCRFNNADVFEIVQETPVTLEELSASWWKTVGQVPGFPVGHPPLLIFKEDLRLEEKHSE